MAPVNFNIFMLSDANIISEILFDGCFIHFVSSLVPLKFLLFLFSVGTMPLAWVAVCLLFSDT